MYAEIEHVLNDPVSGSQLSSNLGCLVYTSNEYFQQCLEITHECNTRPWQIIKRGPFSSNH